MSTIKTDTLQNVAGTLSVPVGTVVSGSAKAWVNFNGTGTVAIRAGFNVSSVTDNGTGDYTVNFTTAMPDANYSLVAMADKGGSADSIRSANFVSQLQAPLTGSCRFQVAFSANWLTDSAYIAVSVFR